VAAVAVVGALVALLALFGSVELNWSFSALTVLVYYALANLSALFVPRELKRIHPAVSVFGLIGCLALALAIGPEVLVPGAVVLGFVVVWYILATHFRKGRT
jgi:APA family basic amino acid/polyamine antiporter